ncbi:MAG: ethanolamine utilization protein EutH [Oscillospiraceae bacterium]|nr:ethanolamine utilization protein EutH [Oscillospiraceae bacterium]
MMNQVLMIVMAAGAVLGGIDRILGNQFGLGEQFEKGFMLLGPMALSMTGMICLAPVLVEVLGRVVVPFYRLISVDPAMFGALLAIDMGGYQLAKGLAADAIIGSYAGLVVSAIFGCTLVFTIPVGMEMIPRADRPLFARGIMLGLAAMPVGLIAGGLLCGLSLAACLHQNLPVFALALLMGLGLWKIPDAMVKGFCLFAECVKAVITVGLALAAVEQLTSWNPVRGMAPIGEAMAVVASIGVVMLGSLPVTELLRRALARPFTRLGGRLGMKPQSLTGMLISLATPLPTISMYPEMDSRGKVAAAAFLVSGTSLLAAHMGFVLSVEPEMLSPLVVGKLGGAFAAVVLALWVEQSSTKPGIRQ